MHHFCDDTDMWWYVYVTACIIWTESLLVSRFSWSAYDIGGMSAPGSGAFSRPVRWGWQRWGGRSGRTKQPNFTWNHGLLLLWWLLFRFRNEELGKVCHTIAWSSCCLGIICCFAFEDLSWGFWLSCGFLIFLQMNLWVKSHKLCVCVWKTEDVSAFCRSFGLYHLESMSRECQTSGPKVREDTWQQILKAWVKYVNRNPPSWPLPVETAGDDFWNMCELGTAHKVSWKVTACHQSTDISKL